MLSSPSPSPAPSPSPSPSPLSPSPDEETVVSERVDDILSGGVGLALFYTSQGNDDDSSWTDVLFDERTVAFGPTVLLYHKPKQDLTLFVRHMVFYLDLTAAELVTANVLYESFLRANRCFAASLSCVRLLMTACISLAIKTLTDAHLTTNMIAAIVDQSGFQLDKKQLGRMEFEILKKLDYQIIRPSALYYCYANELTKLYDPQATPLHLGLS